MTYEEALASLIADGIELGAGDYIPMETLEICKESLEKQIPKKPFLMFCDSDNTEYICDECGCALTGCIDTPSYCPWCGQAIDWRKAE